MGRSPVLIWTVESLSRPGIYVDSWLMGQGVCAVFATPAGEVFPILRWAGSVADRSPAVEIAGPGDMRGQAQDLVRKAISLADLVD